MTDTRKWYREPETFIAVAALVVSLTAVVVGIYEAWLQREHDRAEVWPHLEISTWVSDSGVKLRVDNTGLGPAVVKSVGVTVDGKPERDWDAALTALYGHAPPSHSSATIFQHAVRPGDNTVLVGLRAQDMPPNLYRWVGRVTVRVCYSSVFDDKWTVIDTLGKSSRWQVVSDCPAQTANTDL
ncbi:MAG: hypothetical protein ACJ796_15020 [Gemmatimonadaceae bacterium]